MRELIRGRYPTHGIRGEEDGAQRGCGPIRSLRRSRSYGWQEGGAALHVEYCMRADDAHFSHEPRPQPMGTGVWVELWISPSRPCGFRPCGICLQMRQCPASARGVVLIS